MKIRHLSAFAVFFLMSFAAMSQKTHFTQFTQPALPTELLSYLDQATSDKDKKNTVNITMMAFTSVYNSLDSETQSRVTGICNVMLKLKVRQLPDVLNFVETFNKMHSAAGGKSNFDQWLASIEFIQGRNKKVKDFTDFIDFTIQFLADRTLYGSRSCTWQAGAGSAFRLLCENGDIKIFFDSPMELYYSSDKDNGTIYGTKGVYYYFDNKWVGDGGRLNWDRTGIPTTQCWALLSRYEAVTKFPKFVADSVKFTNTAYFSQPIYGRVEEALSAKMEPEKYSFPKFRSYQKDFEMKDILKGVD